AAEQGAEPDQWRASVVLTGDHREELVRAVVEAGLGLRQLTEDRSELERIFLQLTAGNDVPAPRPEAEA
ncbi:MAG: hypothetical protein K0V04_23675, partial [Deltaproteobacteria bacterium]|nr:hypothetical protein [Deltaproteobacteria bacterium]